MLQQVFRSVLVKRALSVVRTSGAENPVPLDVLAEPLNRGLVSCRDAPQRKETLLGSITKRRLGW